MLKSIVAACGLFLATSAFVTPNAEAQTQYTYLGGAFSLDHCARIAGDAGFRLATFGGVVNGIYYWNACFGSDPVGGGGDGRVSEWDVYVRRGYDDADCVDDIEYELRGVRCRVEREGLLTCRSYRGADRRDFEWVRCVEDAYLLR